MQVSKALNRKVSTRLYILCILLCISLVLAAALVASAIGSGRRSGTIDSVRNRLGESEYTELTGVLAVFDTLGYPNADLGGDVLPAIRSGLHCAEKLDAVLTAEFGTKYTLLDSEVYRYILLTLDELDSAVSQGESTDQAVVNLGEYMLLLRNGLQGRFDASGNLLAVN